MIIELARIAYLAECTLGWLQAGPLRLATIERPWIPTTQHRGGKNRESCVPDGEYTVIKHSSDRFKNVWALINEELDVFYQVAPRPGRTAILIHAGNRVRDVIGCIAVGQEHGTMEGEHAVLRSQLALQHLRSVLVGGPHRLVIVPTRGTV